MSLRDTDPTSSAGESTAKIFVSYSRRDLAFADRLDAALKLRGFDTLIDRSDIYALEDWWNRIEALIAQADTIVFILSPDAVASDICQREVRFAASLNKRLAPVVHRRIDDAAVPAELARLNFIFFDDEALFGESLDRLAEALETDIEWVRKHTEFGEHARRWMTAGRPGPRGLLLRPPALDEAERWVASRPQNAPAPTEDTQAFIAVSRAAHTRQRNVRSASLAAGFFLALTLAGAVYWEWARAGEEATNAEEKQATSFLATVGVLEDKGKLPDALNAAREGQKSFRFLHIRFPLNIKFQKALASADFIVAGAQIADDKYTDASSNLQEATDIWDHLSDAQNYEMQRFRILGYAALGTSLSHEGKASDATAAFNKCFAIILPLVKSRPDDMDLQGQLGIVHFSFAEALGAKLDFDAAAEEFHTALVILQLVVDKRPDVEVLSINIKNWLQMGISEDVDLANRFFENNKVDAGTKIYLENFEILKELQIQSNDSQWQRGLSDLNTKLFMNLDKHVDRATAIRMFREELTFMVSQAEKEPDNVQRQIDLVGAYLFLAGNDDPVTDVGAAVTILKKLEAAGTLPDAFKPLRPNLEAELARYKPQ